MTRTRLFALRGPVCWFILAAYMGTAVGQAQTSNLVDVVFVEGEATAHLAGTPRDQWIPVHPTTTNFFPLRAGDEFKVGKNSRATLIPKGRTAITVGAESHWVVRPDRGRGFRAFLKRGWFYFFHRDRPSDFDLETDSVVAAVRGTEFVMKVESNRTEVIVVDGQVELNNAQGSLRLTNLESAEVLLGEKPRQTASINASQANEVIQWCLYYPGVLNPDEVGLSEAEQQTLARSLAAYREGDLLAALRTYPAERAPSSDAEKVYRAALLLAVGQVEQAEKLVSEVKGQRPEVGTSGARMADALRTLIAAVKFQPRPSTLNAQPSTSSEWLAESYYLQSLASRSNTLPAALEAAQRSRTLAPHFGFAWARVAELEFSFGRTDPAWRAVEKALDLSARNAQALAVKGFLLAARNRIGAAEEAFNRALTVDPALGNAWLGRGLCRIKRGQVEAGRQDVQIAAAREPQRAFLRSYLGKAFSGSGDDLRAEKELQLAKGLDPRDPTAWLYSALLKQQQNRINEAVRDLEKSQELNDNRALYRSRFLLDQDRAVRSANLAGIYQDAGMTEVAVREAARAVQYDYANFSAHLFLANSYDRLRDPNQVELRYETPWLNEYLLANLLAPVGAGLLSPQISQQEYSRLFERDGLGVVSSTEYLSRGAWTQSGAQFGTLGTFAYSLETFYRTDPGQRPNNDIEQRTLDLKLKQAITAKDTLYAQIITYEATSGDMAQYYDPTNAHLAFRARERQKPIALLGWHRAWSPESHTLLLGGMLNDTLEVDDPQQSVLFLKRNAAGQVIAVPVPALPTASLDYESAFNAVTLEGQQIWRPERHTFIVGARYQRGGFDTRVRQGAVSSTLFSDDPPGATISDGPRAWQYSPGLERVSGYGYYNWRMIDPVLLTAGVSYDHLRQPKNFRIPPISPDEESMERISPKAGFILNPFQGTTVRGAFTRSLGGVSFDQSFRLEPTLAGGFNQAWRNLIPESVAGSLGAVRFETWGLGVDQKLASGTYLGVQFERLAADESQSVGTRDFIQLWPSADDEWSVSSARQFFAYEERNAVFYLNQLLGDHFSVGARYVWSEAELQSSFPHVPLLGRADLEATLHQVRLHALFHHRSGFFARAEALWLHQSNHGYTPGLPGDDFWQVNLHAGYRFPRRHAEIRLSLLNVAAQDYRLNPLNLTRELPRERTLAASLRFYF